MRKTLKLTVPQKSSLILWFPRILAIFFTLFISLFAFDVFSEPRWPLALLIHLIPNYFLIGFTVIAWKRPKTGGVLFIFAGLALLLVSRGGAFFLTLLATLVGFLFLVQNSLRSKT